MAKNMKPIVVAALLAVLAPLSWPAMAAGADDSEPPFAEVPEEPAVGGDLRTRRGYAGAAINAQEGIHVLYFLFDDGTLVFYHDEPGMGPILSVDLSSSPDPQEAVEKLVFEDADGDGYNDLRIPVSPGQWKTWRWNPENGTFESVDQQRRTIPVGETSGLFRSNGKIHTRIPSPHAKARSHSS